MNDDQYNSPTVDDNDLAWWDDDDWTLGKERASVVVPKISGFLSMVGSVCIICEVLAEHRSHHPANCDNRRQQTQQVGQSEGSGGGLGAIHRVLLSLSVADLLSSFAWFLSRWPSPTSLENSYHDYWWGAHGSIGWCNFQGYIYHVGLTSSPSFNCILSLYYLLIVKYSWREHSILKLDKWLQPMVWIFATGTAILPIPLHLYNNSYELCWIEASPLECSQDDDDFICTRGNANHAWIYALAFSLFPPYICLMLSIVFMAMIYATVRKVEARNLRYGGISDNEMTRQRSKRVRNQAILYCGAFFLAQFPDIVSSCLYYTTGIWNHYSDLLVYGVFAPCQGLLNFIVFARQREHSMKTPLGRLLRFLLCCCRRRSDFSNSDGDGDDSSSSNWLISKILSGIFQRSEGEKSSENHDEELITAVSDNCTKGKQYKEQDSTDEELISKEFCLQEISTKTISITKTTNLDHSAKTVAILTLPNAGADPDPISDTIEDIETSPSRNQGRISAEEDESDSETFSC